MSLSDAALVSFWSGFASSKLSSTTAAFCFTTQLGLIAALLINRLAGQSGFIAEQGLSESETAT